MISIDRDEETEASEETRAEQTGVKHMGYGARVLA